MMDAFNEHKYNVWVKQGEEWHTINRHPMTKDGSNQMMKQLEKSGLMEMRYSESEVLPVDVTH